MGEPELVATDQKLPPKSLAERLEAEMNGNAAAAEPSPSRMARRFAPDLTAPRPREIKLDLSAIEPWRTAKPRDRDRTGPGAPGPWANAILLAALIVVALVPTVTVGLLMWQGVIPAPWLHSAKQEPIVAAPAIVAVAQASAAAKQPAESPAIALTAPPDLKAEAGKSIPFAISLDSTDALPARSIITISGLPSGATFTDGRPYGDTDWSFRPDEIGDLQLTLPAGASGEQDLDVALISADGTELASAATRLSIAPDPKAALVSRPQDVGLVADLIAHGRKMIEVGYLAGARAYYQRAAEAGSGEAAFALAATYDPALITEIGAQGIKPDVSQARIWYARALALGESRAETELARLNGGETPVGNRPGGASQDAAPAAMQGELSATVQPVAVSSDQAASATAAAVPAAAAAAPATDGSAVADAQWIELSGAANMRENPSGNAAAIKVVQRGTKLREVARQHGWVQVIDPATSQTGWIYSRFVAQAAAGQ